MGSISILFVHTITHIGHLRVIQQTGASRGLVWVAIVVSLAAMLLALYYQGRESIGIIWMLMAFLLISVITEYGLQKFARREITPRTPD